MIIQQLGLSFFMIIMIIKLTFLSLLGDCIMIRLLISLTVLLIVLPKIAIECLIALYQQRRIALWSCDYAGKGLKKIHHRTILIGTRPLADVDQWLHYLKGNIDLTGPSPIEFHQARKMNSNDQVRFNIAPGILSPYKVKQASGIACLLYTSPSPRDQRGSRMPSSA